MPLCIPVFFYAPISVIDTNVGGIFPMHRQNKLHAVIKWCRSDAALLAFLWTAGLFLGTLAAQFAGPSFSLMRPSSGVSIVTPLVAAAFPFLLAAFAVHIHRPKLLLFLCFCKAFCFAFCGCLIWCAYGSAGWLVRFLLMFTDICMVPVLCWFCMRHITGPIISEKRDLAVCIVIAVIVAGIDYFAVSPFLAKLIDI